MYTIRYDTIRLWQVKFNPAHEFLGEFDTSPVLRAYFTASGVRVLLVQPADTTPLWSYYAVASLSIEGHCQCFGHADSCIGQVHHICYHWVCEVARWCNV